jgi:hypothetical protein
MDKGPRQRPVGRGPLTEILGRRPQMKVRAEGPRMKVQGEGLGREIIRVFNVSGRGQPPCPHVIGKRQFTSDLLVRWVLYATPIALVGPLLGHLAHLNMGCPNR